MPLTGPWRTLLFVLHLGWHSGEGYPAAMGRMGMESEWSWLQLYSDSMKDHGMNPPMGYGLSKSDLKISKAGVVKRSFRRAIRRIATHAFCWYRGQCLNRADVPAPLLDQALLQQPAKTLGRMGPRQTGPLVSNNVQVPHHRISTMVWNRGGLSSHRLHEFLTWADCQAAGVYILPETRLGKVTNGSLFIVVPTRVKALAF